MVIRQKSDMGVQICIYTPLLNKALRLYKFVHSVLGVQPIRGEVYKFVHSNNNASDFVQMFLHFAI